MAKDPAFPFYASDFLTGTLYMSMEEKGAYITLLSYQWVNGKIPKKRLGIILGSGFEKVWVSLKDKFVDCGETVYNQRLEDEREKRKTFKEKQSSNGKLGGRPKKNEENTGKPKSQKKPLEYENEKEYEIEEEKENENLKKPCGENQKVSLSEKEYTKLITELGEGLTRACIIKLDHYKNSTGKKYKSDYSAIHSWVIEDVKAKTIKKSKNDTRNSNRRSLDELNQIADDILSGSSKND